ncbi:MAG: hypothetical protein NTZ83_05700, partial [Candidatus Pacearchaeota archaeon]|nr:hypothetical protein [Candidatus Pacearchaeota archaeon]
LYQSLWLKQAEFAAINLNASYKNLSVYTDVKTLFKSETFYKYDALQVEYKLGMNYEIGKNKRFLFNLEHFCSHSIESRQVYYFYDKISVKINIW